MKLKKPTSVFINILTVVSALGAGLGTLPVPSADLPMPPEWRPYIMSAGWFGMVIAFVARTVKESLKHPDDL